ncbi:MAG: MarR family transcriptional regulator [Ignavibacteriae bacterium]|nr:MAG: MarR family transcriptional regulator [Ignavibacteriota bacterium]
MLFIPHKTRDRAERIIGMFPVIMASIVKIHQDHLMLDQEDEPFIYKRGKRFSFTLTFNQYLALMIIGEEHECSVNHVSDRMRIAQSTASQLVDRLVKSKLVQRDIHHKDRRKMIVTLTKEGKEIIEKRTGDLKKSYAKILNTLSDKDQEILEDGFTKLHYISLKLESNIKKCFLGIKHN